MPPGHVIFSALAFAAIILGNPQVSLNKPVNERPRTRCVIALTWGESPKCKACDFGAEALCVFFLPEDFDDGVLD